MKTPTELTKDFIADYKNWNEFAFNESKKNTEESKYNIAKMYDDIILKYCSPEKKYQNLAYGSESAHCPEQEKSIEENVNGTHAIVRTKFTNKKFTFINHDYEYHYSLIDNKWILDECYLVDEDGKYEGL